jgi:hypothetical protein
MANRKHIHLALLTATAAFVIAAGTALGGDPKRPVLDVSKVQKKLTVLTDGAGHYIVVGDWKNRKHLYWGDGTTFYKQRTQGAGNNKKTKIMYFGFWSPRDSASKITRTDKTWKLECSDRETALQVVAKDEAKKLLADATFHSHYWQRKPYALHRDDRGTYYYIDRLRDDDYDAIDFRLYIGQKGNLKRTKLVNIVNDSAGDVFSTKKGELRMVFGGGTQAKWIEGDEDTALKEVYASPKLLYRDLGLHNGNLGVPCDAL